MKITRTGWVGRIMVILSLAGCGQGGGGSDGIDGTGMRGTVAMGKPVTGVQVYLKASNGVRAQTVTNGAGEFRVELRNARFPVLLKIALPQGRTLYGVAMRAGVANVHPITDLIVRNWFGIEGRNIDAEFSADGAIANPPLDAKIQSLANTFKHLLAVIYSQNQVAPDFNPMESPFNANGTGFDAVLDAATATIANNRFSLSLRDTTTQISGEAVARFSLANDFSIADTGKPSKPAGVAALPANNGAVVLIWNASQDNVGVAGYNVYRDNVKLATIAYPVFVDATPGVQQVCYFIEAVDANQNASARSQTVCVTPNAQQSIPAPNAATALSVSALGANASTLSWTPSSSPFVLGYHVYRNIDAGPKTKIATTVATAFTDVNLVAGSTYCYTVQAFNTNGISALDSNQACVAIPQNPPPDTSAPVTSAFPPAGYFPAPLEVTLSCDDGFGSQCARIYYTLDGSAPSTSSNVYAGKLVFEANTTLRYFGVDNAGNIEAPAHTENYLLGGAMSGAAVIQFAAPSLQISESGGAATLQVMRTGAMSHSAAVEYRVLPRTAAPDWDYVPVSGTLVWSADDTAAKTIYVPIKGDTEAEAAESFVVELFNPVSAAIGQYANENVTITDANCASTLANDIVVDTVISAPCTVVTRTINIGSGSSGATPVNLTVNPGVTLIFNSGTGFDIRQAGSLTALGSAEKPIIFTAADKTPGYWDGLSFVFSNSSKNALRHVVVEYGGAGGYASANVTLFGTALSMNRLSLADSRLEHSSGYGFVFNAGSILNDARIAETVIPGFARNIVTNNVLAAGNIDANVVKYLDDASDYRGNAENVVRLDGNATLNNAVHNWPAINVPYLLQGLYVEGQWALNPGTNLRFKQNGFINVRNQGQLRAQGTEVQPIQFTGDIPQPGYWGGIQFTFSNAANLLDHVIVEYGGDPQNGSGNVITYGTANLPQRLVLRNSILRNSSAYGADFSEGANLGADATDIGFSKNIFTDNQGAPISIDLNSVKFLDDASRYDARNGQSHIDVTGNTLVVPSRWKSLDVPYWVQHVYVEAAWTLDPGVTVFAQDTGFINVRTNGARVGSLYAVGTPQRVITFTGSAPGRWAGIQFTFSFSGNVLDYARIENGGATGNNELANVILFGQTTKAAISNSVILGGTGCGIWRDSRAELTGANIVYGTPFTSANSLCVGP